MHNYHHVDLFTKLLSTLFIITDLSQIFLNLHRITHLLNTNQILGSIKQKLVDSFTALSYLPSGIQFISVLILSSSFYLSLTVGRPYLQFAWNCFIKPFLKKKSVGIDSKEHQSRLEEFYADQADIYDVTRRSLLRGRSTMLKLCAAQLRQVH